jgi:hypothetical protein
MSTATWRAAIIDPKEIRLFEAFEHPQFIWRTLAALQRESGMSEPEVIAALWKHSAFVIEGRNKQSGEKVWALRERYWKESGGLLNMFTTSA